jgi:hypothetical protein
MKRNPTKEDVAMCLSLDDVHFSGLFRIFRLFLSGEPGRLEPLGRGPDAKGAREGMFDVVISSDSHVASILRGCRPPVSNRNAEEDKQRWAAEGLGWHNNVNRGIIIVAISPMHS